MPSRASFSIRLAEYAARIDPALTIEARHALTQCGFVYLTLQALLPYCEDPRDWAVVNSCMKAVSPDNPKIAKYFVTPTPTETTPCAS